MSDLLERLREPCLSDDVMRRWDVARAEISAGSTSSHPRDIIEAELDSWDEDRRAAADRIEALERELAQARAAPKFKPLVWTGEKGWRYFGKPPGKGFGQFCIWVWQSPKFGWFVGGHGKAFAAKEEAFAAAQADYECRLLDALE